MDTYARQNSGANVYKNVEVTSADRIKLIVMVYDAAIASLRQAQKCHRRNDILKRNQQISRAQTIIHELNNSLDSQRGQEIAATLRDLYHFLSRHIGAVLTDNEITKIDESLKILTDLRGTWHELSVKVLKGDTPPDDGLPYRGVEGGIYG